MLSGLGLAAVIPTKGRSTYTQAELRSFILEFGRTFGVLQCDPEPALKALAETVTSELGGLTMRASPRGWTRAQGSIENAQATLQAQACFPLTNPCTPGSSSMLMACEPLVCQK